ncbi:hypothetical protein RFI_04370 [Reticulomyxa filosa]|uniref:Uncharacterized protein n=1 Tax=Reticulomyxa filosa TaxID=46433 RepID=X6P3T3_RETFI|nr:hypothetical protein RFI_04370 [Reticulomyxa filosa]|eukprot:ETO32749.1 hypothetical protein RFI_04370 [Reticulomyxa filosa]
MVWLNQQSKYFGKAQLYISKRVSSRNFAKVKIAIKKKPRKKLFYYLKIIYSSIKLFFFIILNIVKFVCLWFFWQFIGCNLFVYGDNKKAKRRINEQISEMQPEVDEKKKDEEIDFDNLLGLKDMNRLSRNVIAHTFSGNFKTIFVHFAVNVNKKLCDSFNDKQLLSNMNKNLLTKLY